MSTNPPTIPPNPFDYGDDAGAGIPEFSDRDAAGLVLPHINYDTQLLAIEELLRAHRSRSETVVKEIKQTEDAAKQSTGLRSERAVDDYIELVHFSIYQDAAHSTAAVGMLAPFIESIFDHAFTSIRQYAKEKNTQHPVHARWIGDDEHLWDCHWVRKRNGNWSKEVAEGIEQLSEAVGLTPFLPADLSLTLKALFAYRNKMLHCGFEWKPDVRNAFDKRIKDDGWPPAWFERATSGGEPWVFYMTDAFIDHCVKTTEAVIDAIGAYCNEKFLYSKKKPPASD